MENSSNNSKYEEVVKLIDKYAALTTNIPAEKIDEFKQRYLTDDRSYEEIKQEIDDIRDKMFKKHEMDKHIDEILSNYYDVIDLAQQYRVIGNDIINQLKQRDIDVNYLFSRYNPQKGMYPLSTKLNQQQIIELASDFFGEINIEFYDYFINDITSNRENISFGNDPVAAVKDDGTDHSLVLSNFGDLRDLYSVVHEYTHLFDSTDGINETRKILTEVNAQCMERCLDSYLLNLSNETLEKYGINQEQLRSDILERNIATFFTRLTHINSINSNQHSEYKIEDVSYMLSQIYSTKFSKLSFEEQTQAIGNMIAGTRNNNFINVISNIPCNLSRHNFGRNDEVLETMQTTEGQIEIILDQPRYEDVHEYVETSQSPLTQLETQELINQAQTYLNQQEQINDISNSESSISSRGPHR